MMVSGKQLQFFVSGNLVSCFLALGISFIGLLVFTNLGCDKTSDTGPGIRLSSPDSLRAYKLKPDQLRLLSEWQDLRQDSNHDSLTNLVRNNYVSLQYIGLLLLEQATLFRIRGEVLTANSKSEVSREIGEDLDEVFRDSFLLNQVDHFESLGDKRLQLRARASKAYASACEPLYDGKYEEAQKKFEIARKLAVSAKDNKLIIDAMSFLQWFLVRNSQHQDVIELGEQIVEKAKKIGYKRRLATALRLLAEAFRDIDHDQEALMTIERAIRIADFMNDRYVLANSYLIEAQIYSRMENYQAAEETLQKVTKIYGEGNFPGFVKLHKAQIYVERGEYGKAQLLYEEAVDIFRQQNDKMNEAITLTELSYLQLQMGEYETALKLEKQSMELLKLEKNEEQIAFSFSNLGLIYDKLDSLDKAINCHQQALQLIQSGGKRLPTDFWLRLGDVQFKKGELCAALESFTTAQRLANSINYQLGKAGAFIGHGRIALSQDQPDLAKKHFTSALQISENIEEPRLKAAAYFGLTQVQRKSNNLVEASRSIDRAINSVEKLRTAIYRDSLRVSYFATIQELFDEAILLSLAQGQKALALHYAERARARALLDALGRPTLEEIGEERLVKLETAVPAVDKLLENISASVQVIEYRITPDTLLIWLLNQNHLVLRKVSISSLSLVESVQHFLQSIGAENLKTFQKRVNEDIVAVYNENRQLGKQLYKLLVEPIANELALDKNLVIIPDGALHRLPFGALVNQDDRFFDEDHVYTKASSLSIPYESSKSPRPVLQPLSSQFLMVAGDFPSKLSQKRIVKQLFTNAVVLEKEKASYSGLKEALRNGPGIVYLSVHAVADVGHPMNSYIELHSDNATNGNGPWTKVYARQLLDLDFSSTYLAVLNACETSSGKIVDGEGVLNLVRIFSLSRIPVVVASLWRNDDRRSAEIISEFYRGLTNGKGIAESLQQATKLNIQKLKNDYGYPLPYFWAGLEVYQNSWLNQNQLLTHKYRR